MKTLERLLTVPGDGLVTVHTGRERKEQLWQSYYGTTDVTRAKKNWLESLSQLDPSKPWLLGVPSDCGGGIHRGANWGPLSLRAELLDARDKFVDLGDVRVIPHLLHDKYLNPETIRSCQRALYGRANRLPVSPLSIAEYALRALYKTAPKARVFGVGGDHSVSLPLVQTWLESREHQGRAAILHFDAHTDLLPSRLGIDFCFGSWTYHILPLLADPAHVVQVGIRSTGRSKAHWEKELGVKQIWAQDFRLWGPTKTYDKIRRHFRSLGVEEIYVSFDVDALDERYASATGTPEPGGLLPHDCAALIRLLAKDFQITGADLMELAPFVNFSPANVLSQRSSVSVAGDIAKILLSVLSSSDP